MQVENELRACPFCGNNDEDEFVLLSENEGFMEVRFIHNVSCSCGAQGPRGDTKQEAIERWNRRKGGENK
jgi:Lar family restriction alleviation protein